MPLVVGVRFKSATKVYYFDPSGLDLHVGDPVIVETVRAKELGTVVAPPRKVVDEEIVGQLRPVLGRAAPMDLVNSEHYANQERAAVEKCRAKAAEHGLQIKVVRAEYNYDGTHLSFFFTAEHRVDFRALVRDLARIFRTRIELRQIGVRDEAKLVAGLGPCGRPLCCAQHLCEFSPVSIKMAKQQHLPLSPMEISGMCGRLLCCLTYENDFYREAQAKMPRLGDTVRTGEGRGRVTDYNVLKETVNVELESGAMVEVPLNELSRETAEQNKQEQGQQEQQD